MIKQTTIKLVLAVLLPITSLAFVISDWAGAWDRFRGLHHVEAVAERLETSYAEGVDRQIGPDEKAWIPLMRLITNYSKADLPKDRQPKLLARAVAIQSAKIDVGQGKIAEWTAPSTPIILVYADWPGQKILPESYRIVGTIGDIRTWIARSKADFTFLVHDVSFVLITIALALVLWHLEKNSKTPAVAEQMPSVYRLNKEGHEELLTLYTQAARDIEGIKRSQWRDFYAILAGQTLVVGFSKATQLVSSVFPLQWFFSTLVILLTAIGIVLLLVHQKAMVRTRGLIDEVYVPRLHDEIKKLLSHQLAQSQGRRTYPTIMMVVLWTMLCVSLLIIWLIELARP